MHLALRIAHRDGLGAHGLAAARSHEPHRHIGVGRLDRRAHHLAAEIAFGDDAIGAIFMKGHDRATAPDGRCLAAGEIGENIAIAVDAARGDDKADFVGAEIIASRRTGRIERHDDGSALLLRNSVRLAARRIR